MQLYLEIAGWNLYQMAKTKHHIINGMKAFFIIAKKEYTYIKSFSKTSSLPNLFHKFGIS